MIEKVISGFQTGADIAGVKAAKACNIPTGGYIPKGFKTLDGARRDYAELYGAVEHSSTNYAQRTWDNVHNSDGTVRFAKEPLGWKSSGERCTLQAIRNWNKPHFDIGVPIDHNKAPRWMIIDNFIAWITKYNIKILNVAGNSERTCPGIEKEVYDFLVEVFVHLRKSHDDSRKEPNCK